MKAIGPYFPVVLFIMMYKVVHVKQSSKVVIQNKDCTAVFSCGDVQFFYFSQEEI